MLLLGCGRGPCRSFPSSPRRHLQARGAGGPAQLRPGIPAWQDKRGTSPAKDDGPGSRQAAVERKRRRDSRSASGISFFSSFPSFV
ncbi:hypothetical protein ELH42_29665 (plasmid) [Rhizobium ruizarguesonis]|nr:hypothetical protein ELH85_31015 [Rhizobium ruizarguesonis]TBA33272.1 hypothetical protein ELH62_29630 [Rhizobium ruizarguesonis]TBB60009.1 hypothetical protein ELH42_29665 [Rhizobium ruizarguesonis]TCA35446.1 hypothetical protein E0H70_03630 [Rhizobium leguminosarum bv. viciae]